MFLKISQYLQRPATLLKRGLQHSCFSVNIAKSFKNRLFYKTPLLPATGDYAVALTLRGIHGRYPLMVLQTLEKFL